MALNTIVAATDVQTAGNLSDRIETNTLIFYIEIASLLFREMIGTTVYQKAAGEYMPCGSAWTDEGTDTYSIICEDLKIDKITDDDDILAEKDSVADVQATAGSWYLDVATKKLYVHATDDDNLSVPLTIFIVKFIGYLDSDVLTRLKKAEALMTVSFALPAIGMVSGEQGILSALSLGTGGQMEVMSYAKEIMELAGAFMNLAIRIASGYLITEKYQEVWHHVILRMFPSLDEMPTVATIKSEDETLLKYYRGDVAYEPKHDDAVS